MDQRAIALAAVCVVCLAFILVLVGLAVGNLVLAGAGAAVLVVAWFAVRSWQKRRART